MKRKEKLALLVILLTTSNIIGFMPDTGIFYFLVMFGLLIYYCSYGGKITFNIPMICLIFVAALSTVINDPPAYFRSWQRLGLFIIIAGVVSPLIQNTKFILFRINLFQWLLKLLVVVTVLSFIAYFLGINYAISFYEIENAHFGGIATHSMLLAPIASISLCYSVWLITNRRKYKKKYRYLYTGFAVVSFLVLLLAASRIAFLAAIAGLLFLLYKLNRQHFGKFIKSIFVVAMLLVVTLPLWDTYSIRLLQKQESNIKAGSATFSREAKWNARQAEFNSNPLLGVGYFAASEENSDDFDELTGQVETGSSWLAILSMLGISGFVPFALLFFKNVYYLYKDSKNVASSALLGSILIFFMVHMSAEGYVFGAGGFLFFSLWLTLGTAEAYRKTFFSF